VLALLIHDGFVAIESAVLRRRLSSPQ